VSRISSVSGANLKTICDRKRWLAGIRRPLTCVSDGRCVVSVDRTSIILASAAAAGALDARTSPVIRLIETRTRSSVQFTPQLPLTRDFIKAYSHLRCHFTGARAVLIVLLCFVGSVRKRESFLSNERLTSEKVQSLIMCLDNSISFCDNTDKWV